MTRTKAFIAAVILSLVSCKERLNCLHRLHLIPFAISGSLIVPPGAPDKLEVDLRIIVLCEALEPPCLDVVRTWRRKIHILF